MTTNLLAQQLFILLFVLFFLWLLAVAAKELMEEIDVIWKLRRQVRKQQEQIDKLVTLNVKYTNRLQEYKKAQPKKQAPAELPWNRWYQGIKRIS